MKLKLPTCVYFRLRSEKQHLRKAGSSPQRNNCRCFFFRKIFTELRKQLKENRQELPPDVEGGEDNIPIEMFQRSFERLFYVLADGEVFDAQAIDKNKNGYVGWGEFAYVFKKRNISIKLSLPERIYLTFDNPDTSLLAQFLSMFVLLIISLSSVCFILSTSPEFQKEPQGSKKPEPEDAFDAIENICLTIFVIEYFIRLCTCWAVRDEVFDKKKLLDLTIGSEVINASYPAKRLVTFVISPANLIDLVAILPGIMGWISKIVTPNGDGLEGGGFVVLRLVRLTRIFRAFKNPTLVEPVIVIARTIINSTKALYVLGFNLLLGILIFGSLMYVFEKGEWEPETRTYNRYVGRKWNSTSFEWEDVTAESPFLSIPHAFWWAVVTAMTVGYGDMFPTRTMGYIVATATMVFSLVILALPVGVIGGNFSQAWAAYESEKIEAGIEKERDIKYITSAIQRIEPFEMSRLMLIEVWNERCPVDRGNNVLGPPRECRLRPDVAEFMGQVNLKLELPPDRINVQSHTLRLKPAPNGKREVCGSITVQYEWTPMANTADDGAQTIAPEDSSFKGNGVFAASPTLRGRLKVIMIGGDNMMNLSYHNYKRKTYSNPYAMVFVYPNSPISGEALCPSAWRTPCDPNTLFPRWGAHQTWNFCWLQPALDSPRTPAHGTSAIHPEPGASDSDGTENGHEFREDEILNMLQRFGRDVQQLRDEVRDVSGRIFRRIESPAPVVEPFAPTRSDR